VCHGDRTAATITIGVCDGSEAAVPVRDLERMSELLLFLGVVLDPAEADPA